MKWNNANIQKIRMRLMEIQLLPEYRGGERTNLIDTQGRTLAEQEYQMHRLSDPTYQSIILADYINLRLFYYIEKCPNFYVATRSSDEHGQKIILTKKYVREIETNQGEWTYSLARRIFEELEYREHRFGV
jgi:hypothetical protein